MEFENSIESVAESFIELGERISKNWSPYLSEGKTFYEIHGWQNVPLRTVDAEQQAYDIAHRLRDMAEDEDPSETQADDYWVQLAEQADLLTYENFPSDQIGMARSTFEFLSFCVLQLPTRPADVNWAEVKSKPYIPREIVNKIRSLEARLDDLLPRSTVLEEKIELIESAHSAAEQLPTDMAELKKSRTEVSRLQSEVQSHADQIKNHHAKSETGLIDIESNLRETDSLVERCNENYRITTSAGLAGAFESRSKSLIRTGWVWVVILAAALVAAIGIGASRLEDMKVLMATDIPTSHVVLNMLVTALGIGAPVWLAWLSTRNIGQSFKLAEDYAFKASISKAYEGYRKEAVNLDESFARTLFGSALSRLDEVPSRVLADKEHNSPLEALLDHPAIQKLVETTPELKDKLMQAVMDSSNVASAAVGATAASVSGAFTGERKNEDSEQNDKGDENSSKQGE